jgi:hypothetical protein
VVEVGEVEGRVPAAARYVVDDRFDVGVEAVAAAPLLVADDRSSRRSELARALCRYEVDGRTGVGWSEWLDPAVPS